MLKQTEEKVKGDWRSRIWDTTDGAATKKKESLGWREHMSQYHKWKCDSIAGKLVPSGYRKEDDSLAWGNAKSEA